MIRYIKSWWLHRQIKAGKAPHGRVIGFKKPLSLWQRVKNALKALGRKYES